MVAKGSGFKRQNEYEGGRTLKGKKKELWL